MTNLHQISQLAKHMSIASPESKLMYAEQINHLIDQLTEAEYAELKESYLSVLTEGKEQIIKVWPVSEKSAEATINKTVRKMGIRPISMETENNAMYIVVDRSADRLAKAIEKDSGSYDFAAKVQK